MGLTGLPINYSHWQQMRNEHLRDNTVHSKFTVHLYLQYRKHLGYARYQLLKQAQVLVVPKRVNDMLKLGSTKWLSPVIGIYKLTRLVNIHNLLKNAILPPEYKAQIIDLDVV